MERKARSRGQAELQAAVDAWDAARTPEQGKADAERIAQREADYEADKAFWRERETRMMTTTTYRNLSAMERKAAECQVSASDAGVFVVKSPSGSVYTVTPGIAGAPASGLCTCRWAVEKHSTCSHLLAVIRFAERVLAEKKD